MDVPIIEWNWCGETIRLGAEMTGAGPTVLLLPALSSISTRHEMRPPQERLRSRYRTVAIDWPGFGDRPRPALAWMPDTYEAFLAFILAEVTPAPHAVIAAGHAATYALAHACACPGSFARLVLLAPTWRGPLPTMMNGRRPFMDRLRRAVDLPVLGPILYSLNVNRIVIRHMAAGHVYVDPGWLNGERLREKLAVTKRPWRSVRIGLIRDGSTRSGCQPRELSRLGTTRTYPDADRIRSADAAAIARGDGRAYDRSGYALRAAAAGQARVA
jgi:pimeloyl-ACP methyl ester carboxylesterase